MGKASQFNLEKYNGSFPSRLRDLLSSRNKTQQQLADKCDVKRQSISQWANGITSPDIVSLRKIAEFFNVSADYLLGLSNEPTTDTNMAAVCKYTGLSEKSVWVLHYLKTVGYTTKADDIGHIINILLENTWSAYNLKSNCTHRTILSSLGLFFEIESKGNPAVTINQDGEICPDSGNLLFSPTQIKLNDRIIENALLMEISQALVELKETMKEGENNG